MKKLIFLITLLFFSFVQSETFKKGDTVSNICKKNNITIQEFIKVNPNIKDINKIFAGQKYNIPNKMKMISPTMTKRAYEEAKGDYKMSHGEISVNIIGRKTWGASPRITKKDSKGNDRNFEKVEDINSMKNITIHHTTDSDQTVKGIKTIQSKHQSKNESADIGYHYIVTSDGKIYEGRPLGYTGSHVKEANTNNIGIAVQGDFEPRLKNFAGLLVDKPTKKQKKSLKNLVFVLKGNYKIKDKNIKGHNEINNTKCPGKNLKDVVLELKGEKKKK